jgi:hypothetical protein
MLLDEVERLDAEVMRLESFEERYHEADKQVGVLQEKRRRDIAIDVVYAICVGLGTGFVMLSPTLPAAQVWPAVGLGGILIISGIAVKVRGR